MADERRMAAASALAAKAADAATDGMRRVARNRAVPALLSRRDRRLAYAAFADSRVSRWLEIWAQHNAVSLASGG
jgi:hypothetical protein